VKLLRTLQEGEVKRVGGQSVRRVNARLLCATNRDLRAAVKQGQFREDLYYRINVFPIQIPPLRERPGDVLPLAQHFIERSRRELGRNVTGLSRAAIGKLLAYSWPGNVRQLDHSLKQAMVRAAGERIEAEDLVLDDDGIGTALGQPLEGGNSHADGMTLREARDRFTKRYLETLLEKMGGNVSRAAEQAGKHRSDFYELLNRYKIDPSRYRDPSERIGE
jgi:DNA-binding NtrC family response regulator